MTASVIAIIQVNIGASLTDPVEAILIGAAIILILSAVIVSYRIVFGPTMQDRVIAVNSVGTTTVVVLALLAAALDRPGFLDIALVYAMLNFLMSIAISKFTVERGGVI
ncbi:monovalent cation/H+ antiporter complex subunit F [Haloquadratum walsbyi]|uniref:Mrp-type sodium/proton antiporter system subunit F n=1 Tax=Haloquadratum walsbyi (strain DSM 16854 / JCM 12705 / C23) TaxID=768065 RepID=G0LI01_HALWC|nr:monovalent cation/H+ antiporter complex subunit F [Haloquadratum walsbyi]CCC39721.1 Mrp-type sodium/proton antiporter system subunit F [Haloquadratum walsbyi C23]